MDTLISHNVLQDPLITHNVFQDPMISILNLIVIAILHIWLTNRYDNKRRKMALSLHSLDHDRLVRVSVISSKIQNASIPNV